MSAHDELYPSEVSMVKFRDAYELHNAAASIRRIHNTTDLDSTLLPEVRNGRRQILDISYKLLLVDRNNALDEFCALWLKHRGLVK